MMETISYIALSLGGIIFACGVVMHLTKWIDEQTGNSWSDEPNDDFKNN